MKVMALRRADTCATCTSALPAGTTAVWVASERRTYCRPCYGSPTEPFAPSCVPEQASATSVPAAGASAQREYERRARNREERVRTRHPRLGGLLLALSEEPSSTRVWSQGAAGERAVASTLNGLDGEHVLVLHDRRLRHPDGRLSRANVDHLAVTAGGVWVIDAKTHRGTLEVRRAGGLLSPRVEKLYIGGRDKTSLLDGLQRQVEAVRTQLTAVEADVPVRGALCFVGTELPWFGSAIGGVPLVGRRGLKKLMRQPGDFSAELREAVTAYLAERFPSA